MATLATTLGLSACAPSQQEDGQAALIGRSEIAADHLTPELLQELGRITDVQPSPDGTRLLYGVTYNNVAQNRSNRELFVLTPGEDGNDVRQITHTAKGEQNAVWSLDGQKIFFMSSESGTMQLWQMQADGTQRRQLSTLEQDLEGFLLSPDQQQVLLIMTHDVERLDSTLFEGLDKTTGRLWDEMNYRHWDDFVNNCPHPYLATFNADGTLRQESLHDILEGQPYECPMRPFGGVESFAWRPDGTQLVYVCRKETGTRYAFSTRSSIYLYDIVSGRHTDLHPGDHGYDTCPRFNADGTLLAYLSMARNGYESDKNRLCILPTAGWPVGNEGSEAEPAAFIDLTADYDNSCDDYTWNPDGQGLTFVSYSYGTSKVFGMTLDGQVRQLSPEGDHDYASACYMGQRLITLRHDMHSPNEVFEITATDDAPVAKALTHENDALLSQLGDMGRIERRMMRCTNGDSMLVWVAYPVGFDEARAADPTRKFPTLLYCQGGPESAVSQFWSVRWNVAIMQANGYVVVLPNRHGVPGFGQAYNEQICGDFAGQCMRDYFTAIDNIAREPWCDADRLGAIGASFGGYSVYYLAGHHQKRFKCFIAHCGIYNTESMYSETEEMWFADWDYGGAPFAEHPNKAYTDSPHKSVTKWDTPILVIHNEHDYRIPVTQGMQAFNTARMLGVPAQFLYFPDECHWVTKPQNAVLWQRVFFNWLDRWLKTEN